MKDSADSTTWLAGYLSRTYCISSPFLHRLVMGVRSSYLIVLCHRVNRPAFLMKDENSPA